MQKRMVLAFILFVFGCGQMAGQKGLLDSFEGELTRKSVDYGSSSNSSINVEPADDSVCGKQSLKLTYRLGQDGYLYCARGYGLDVLTATWEAKPPQELQFDQYQGIRLNVKGNQKGAVAFDVKDAGGEIFRYLMDVSAEGWQEVTIPFTSFKGREDWQPNSATINHTLDFPIRSFQFEPKTLGEGIYFFDCVKLYP